MLLMWLQFVHREWRHIVDTLILTHKPNAKLSIIVTNETDFYAIFPILSALKHRSHFNLDRKRERNATERKHYQQLKI